MSQFKTNKQEHREKVCNVLGITSDHFDWFQLAAVGLRAVYEGRHQDTGEADIFSYRIESLAAQLGLFVYYNFSSVSVEVYLGKEKLDWDNYEKGCLV